MWLRVLFVALVVWATWWAFGISLQVLGLGPWGETMRVISTAGDQTPPDADIEAFFKAAGQTILLSRVVLWPVAVLVGALFYLWFVPSRSLAHPLVIGLPTLELELLHFHRTHLLWYLAYVLLFVLVVSLAASRWRPSMFQHVWHAS